MELLKNISKRQINVLYAFIHVLTWNMVFLIPFVLFMKPLEEVASVLSIFLLVKAVFLFYINYFILVPKLLLNKKIGLFLTSLIILLALNLWVNIGTGKNLRQNHKEDLTNGRPFPHEEFNPNENNEEIIGFKPPPPVRKIRLFTHLSFTLVLIGVSTSLKLTEEFFKNQKFQEQIKHEKLNTELSFLKAQINPHFLFNSLNSIYSLAHKKSDLAPESIIRLSKIMRYVIDDSNNTKVSLSKELDHLIDYIELQKLRLTKKTKVAYVQQVKGNASLIEPMLLVPFIENAFKHGVDSVNDSVITIKVDVDENVLSLKCSNTVARQKTETSEAESGIGFKNVKRRLELLYPNKHQLSVVDNKKLYSVSLKLTLQT